MAVEVRKRSKDVGGPPTLTVHPVAAVFPMLGTEELAQLAEDIRVNGLVHPIAVDPAGQVLDGRNRLAACRIAGVAPRFVTVDPANVLAFVVSQNVNRRHMGSGARAMAIVRAIKLQPTAFHGSRDDLATAVGVNHDTLSQANVVADFAPELADQVLAGGSLREAWEVATERRRQADADTKALRKLKRAYPDLARQVADGTITLEAAREAVALIERATRLAADQQQAIERITLRQEAITSLIPASAPVPDGDDYIPQGPHRPPPTVGDVLDEILAEIDEAALDRADELRERLRVLDRLLAVIEPHEPNRLAEGLTADEAEYMASVLLTAMRWVAVARQAALWAAEPGRLEVVK